MANLYHSSSNVKVTARHQYSIPFLLFSFILLSFSPSPAAARSILDFGAIPNGVSDSTVAFARAWGWACSSKSPALIHVPRGRFVIRPVSFTGPCRNRVTLWMDGSTILTNPNHGIYTKAGYVMQFYRVNGLLIRGGTIDARGKAHWACRMSGRCTSMGAILAWCSNVEVRGFTSLDSYRVHINVFKGKNMLFRNIKLIAPETSPNTDGIHLSNSDAITIFNSVMKTGDDCISIGPSSSNFRIQRITCGPGHGISIGSLANSYDEGGVENIMVSGVVFTKTLSGVRIKTWEKPSKSYVRNVEFKNIVMKNVNNPILIDQKYCPHNLCSVGQNSGVKISDITYKNIKGTSSSKEAVKFDCSPSNGCKRIKLHEIHLVYNKKNEPAYSTCKYADGSTNGKVLPKSCL